MLVTCLDESLGAWDYYWGWFCSCYNLVRFVHVRVRVSLCVCVAFDRCWQFKFVFASFIHITLFSILPLFMLLYSSPVLEPNPVLKLAPPSSIVNIRLTWSVTNCCVCLRAVCVEHAWWQDLCWSWLQKHHQSLAMRICLPFGPETSGKARFLRELAP